VCNNFPGTSLPNIGDCRQDCGGKVKIDVGAGPYCYNWCDPGKERGSDLSTVDTCSRPNGGGCDRAKACPYKGRSQDGAYTYTEGQDQDGQTIMHGGSKSRRDCELFCDSIDGCNGIVSYASSSGGSGSCWAVRGFPNPYSRGGSAIASRLPKVTCSSGNTLQSDKQTCCATGLLWAGVTGQCCPAGTELTRIPGKCCPTGQVLSPDNVNCLAQTNLLVSASQAGTGAQMCPQGYTFSGAQGVGTCVEEI